MLYKCLIYRNNNHYTIIKIIYMIMLIISVHFVSNVSNVFKYIGNGIQMVFKNNNFCNVPVIIGKILKTTIFG